MTDVAKVVCDKCEKVLKSEKSKQTHKCKQTYVCDKCEKKYSKQALFATHKLKCTGKKPAKQLVCNTCTAAFRKEEKFKNHKCEDTVIHKCECGKTYKSKNSFEKHVKECPKHIQN